MDNFENMTTPQLLAALESKEDYLAMYWVYLPETDKCRLTDEIRDIRLILAFRKA